MEKINNKLHRVELYDAINNIISCLPTDHKAIKDLEKYNNKLYESIRFSPPENLINITTHYYYNIFDPLLKSNGISFKYTGDL
jgi:hypothetical protein